MTFNHCSLASQDTEKEQQYLYAYGALKRLKTGKATRNEIIAELSKRSDEKEVKRILNELRRKSDD
ncbi:hypothetical protein RHO15_09695 [Utexia brackfieldae]|uniref:hypothetical protein n=1 Tax=Utexia brackfieldae TaxID=3074108 RepID=UPI00370D0E55